jgi:hypothetical protein
MAVKSEARGIRSHGYRKNEFPGKRYNASNPEKRCKRVFFMSYEKHPRDAAHGSTINLLFSYGMKCIRETLPTYFFIHMKSIRVTLKKQRFGETLAYH